MARHTLPEGLCGPSLTGRQFNSCTVTACLSPPGVPQALASQPQVLAALLAQQQQRQQHPAGAPGLQLPSLAGLRPPVSPEEHESWERRSHLLVWPSWAGAAMSSCHLPFAACLLLFTMHPVWRGLPCVGEPVHASHLMLHRQHHSATDKLKLLHRPAREAATLLSVVHGCRDWAVLPFLQFPRQRDQPQHGPQGPCIPSSFPPSKDGTGLPMLLLCFLVCLLVCFIVYLLRITGTDSVRAGTCLCEPGSTCVCSHYTC